MKKFIALITLGISTVILTGCTQTPDPQPILFNLGGVTIPDDINAFDSRKLDTAHGKTVSVFIFGQPLPQNPGEPQRINPNFEFGGLTQPIQLVSAINGVVSYIQNQPETHDYEVFIRPNNNSKWTVDYDHVADLQVSKGQSISVGDVLGKAAQEQSGDYRYELQIGFGNNENDTVFYCPTDLLDDSIKYNTKNTMDAFVTSWNTSYRNVFGDNAYPSQIGGCVKPTITNPESQGK